MSDKRFVKDIKTVPAEYNRKCKVSDTRRILVCVVFNDGTIWYPKDKEIEEIVRLKAEVYKHNLQYPNIDNEVANNEATKND